MPTGPTSLFDVAEQLRAAAAAAVASTTGGAIGNSFVCVGEPVWDCELLAVSASMQDQPFMSPNQVVGDPLHRVYVGSLNVVTLVVTVLRCVKAMEGASGGYLPPAAATQEHDASVVYEDGWVLWNELRAAIRAGTLFAGLGGAGNREAVVGPLVAASPEGALGGWRLQVQVEVDGYTS